MSPTAVIASQLSALQRNDYPEQDAGAGVAYAFTIPEGCEAMLPGGVGVSACTQTGQTVGPLGPQALDV